MTNAPTIPTKPKTIAKAKDGKSTIKRGSESRSVSGPRLKLLNAAARLARLHKGKAPRDQVALLAGYPNAGTAGFKKMLSTLKKEGFLFFDSGALWLTDEGLASAGEVERVTTNDDFHDAIRETIQVPKYRLAFDFLLDGQARSKAELAKELDYPNQTTAGFKKMLTQIRKHAFVGSPGDNKDLVYLKDEAFPFGRPIRASVENDTEHIYSV